MRFFFSHALVYRVSFEVDAQWELRDPCGEPAEPPGVQSISTALLVAVVASFVVLFACVPSIIAFLLIKHKKDRVSNTKLGRTSSNRSINEDTSKTRKRKSKILSFFSTASYHYFHYDFFYKKMRDACRDKRAVAKSAAQRRHRRWPTATRRRAAKQNSRPTMAPPFP